MQAFLGIAAVFPAAALLLAQASPRMSVVEPGGGKAGTELTVTGEGLSKASALKVYASDGKSDTELVLSLQQDKSIKFKIPDGLKPGRYGLAVLTKDSKILDQPVKFNVE